MRTAWVVMNPPLCLSTYYDAARAGSDAPPPSAIALATSSDWPSARAGITICNRDCNARPSVAHRLPDRDRAEHDPPWVGDVVLGGFARPGDGRVRGDQPLGRGRQRAARDAHPGVGTAHPLPAHP